MLQITIIFETLMVGENTPFAADFLIVGYPDVTYALYFDGESADDYADNSAFAVDGNGKITFKGAGADFEKPADANGDNFYKVAVAATADGETTPTAIYYLTIKVEDIDGVAIRGTKGNDIVDAAATVAGQPMATPEGDTILGFKGRDDLSGLGGDDFIAGGRHKDTLIGGAGADCFVFAEKVGKKNADLIADFAVGEDTIYLDGDVFKKLKTAGDGHLKGTYFQAGKPENGKDLVLYKNGKLFFDGDGDGGRYDKALFAKIGKGLDLSGDDFVVV